jgi:hypothetical protein
MSDYILIHHGIKGQKWGIIRSLSALRKNRRTSDTDSNQNSKKKSPKVKKVKRVSMKDLSDDELKKILNRMDMEKRYAQLNKKEKNSANKFVGDLLRDSAKETAKKYVSQYMSKGVDYLLKEAVKQSKK